jgi:hypothetical protein
MASMSTEHTPERDQTAPPYNDYDDVDATITNILETIGLKKRYASMIDLNLIDEDIIDKSTVQHRNS